MANIVLMYATTGVALAAFVGTLLAFYHIAPIFLFISPILYALAVLLFAVGVGLRQPVAIAVLFAVLSVFFLGISIDHWFGLPGFL